MSAQVTKSVFNLLIYIVDMKEQEETLMKRLSDQLTYFMQKAKEQLSSVDSPRDLLRFVLYPSASPQVGPVTFLSNVYPSADDIAFLDGNSWLMRLSN